mmetsp:Transcript_25199/g.50689  ORF Transcript_25199/g.50689 Transcript_25199/m.50689 type:complete len:126 (-) Transcript_25199:983-1360(-)
MVQVQSLIDETAIACGAEKYAVALSLSERTLMLLRGSGLDTPVVMGPCHFEAYQLCRAVGGKAKGSIGRQHASWELTELTDPSISQSVNRSAAGHLHSAWKLTELSDGADSPLAMSYGSLVAAMG